MLRELIHKAVLSETRQPYKRLRASALGGCPRAHYYKIEGLEATTPPNLGALMNFKMGYVWEDTILPLLEKVGAKVTKPKEPWVDDALNVSGTPDYLIEIDGKKIIPDSKTVNSGWFFYQEKAYKKALAETGISKNEFLLRENEAYEIQLGTYLLLAKRMGLDYDHARLLFVNKDNSFIGWEVEVHLTPELEDKILKRVDLVNTHLEAGVPPECECEGWKVGYCDYGQPSTRKKNTKGKWINTACCGEVDVIEKWQTEQLPEGESNG